MAIILALSLPNEIEKTKNQSQTFTRSAQVIIFPGVRYERIPDTKINLSKSAKKARKTA